MEGEGLDTAEDYQYNFRNKKRGLAVIINNWEFPASDVDLPPDIRVGSLEDAKRLETSFKALGFDVMVKENLNCSQILKVLKQDACKDYNHTDADCFVCAVLSHGDRKLINDELVDVILGVDSLPNNPEYVKTKAILDIFNDKKCPGLTGKPRLFFFQSCRGNQYDSGVDILLKTKKVEQLNIQPKTHRNVDGNVNAAEGTSRLDQVDAGKGDEGASASPEPKVSPVPLYEDCLVMYATPPGYYAWRRSTGSWFITELCNVLDSGIVYRKSFTTCMTRVCRQVAQNYKSDTLDAVNESDTEEQKREKEERNIRNKKSHDQVVVPVFESMLLKDIVFTNK